MYRFPVFFLWFACCLFASCGQRHASPPLGFYYWQTGLALDGEELATLKELRARYLYVRLFDVDTMQGAAGAVRVVPVGTLHGSAVLPDSVEIVPVVYLTRQAMVHMDSADSLASRLERRVLDLLNKQQWTFNEIQWDFDWTPSTREPYFALLRALKARPGFAGKMFSATIRLHQVKFRAKTGLPPVDKGLLMCYNMGNLKQYAAENSILDEDLSRDYLENLSSYPLPLDVALPVFGWGLQFRKQQFQAILNGVEEGDLQDSTLFVLQRPQVYRALRTCRVRGFVVQSGDEIRMEWPEPAVLQSVARYVGRRNASDTSRLLFFHLHPTLTQHYPTHELQRILDAY